MSSRLRHLLRTSAALVLVVLGLVGLILPLMPGIPFLIAGLAILGSDHPLRARIMRWLGRIRGTTTGPRESSR